MRTRSGRPHDEVAGVLTEQVEQADLSPLPGPLAEAITESAVSGNAYVVSQLSALLDDVPQPNTRRSGETID